MSGDYCRWIVDKEVGRILIPGCYGAAVYGPGGCTCSATQKRDGLEDRLADLERKVARLMAQREETE